MKTLFLGAKFTLQIHHQLIKFIAPATKVELWCLHTSPWYYIRNPGASFTKLTYVFDLYILEIYCYETHPILWYKIIGFTFECLASNATVDIKWKYYSQISIKGFIFRSKYAKTLNVIWNVHFQILNFVKTWDFP
jgi:hypothetical protein